MDHGNAEKEQEGSKEKNKEGATPFVAITTTTPSSLLFTSYFIVSCFIRFLNHAHFHISTQTETPSASETVMADQPPFYRKKQLTVKGYFIIISS
ncbi:hypothetical protein CAEBREN_11120 [Caenorhabditis brenneri]|uniref:Uncharacterized protein n=1 Tax=Caenorhabditis brenneri TaxID=135651 RepID=G0MYX6_CAEBE|nr:hypothetical protein CAEBREN_11120 [Caenorhabditis brenneri]